MALFDLVNFNGEVFDAAVRETPNLRLNELLHCGAIVERGEYASLLPDQKGGNFITTLIKARLSGKTVNYDGKTDITAEERGNYTMGRIVVGRAQGWTEKDFVSDISGDDYSAAAGEVAEFWDDVDQDTLLSILKGVFSMSTGEGKKFVDAHTYDITAETENTFGPTTLNNAMQKALGDKKANFSLAIMHSVVATNLENLKLLDYMKYTDADGIERDLGLATLNGSDVADGSASAWTTVSKLSSGEKHSSIFAKVSQMFKNVRYLYKMLGTTDISKIGNGTCTGAISSLNSGLANKYFLKVLAKDWSGFVGTLFPQFNVQNDNVVDIYADKTDGTYPAVRVARASADYDGNNIPDTYLKKSDAKNNVSGLSNTATNYNDQTPVVQYFTVPDDGYYLITGLVTFSSNANGFREVFITNTTSNYVMGRVRVPAVSGGAVTLQVTSGGTFGPGQTGTLSTYQNSGSNLNVQEWLSMVKIAPKL